MRKWQTFAISFAPHIKVHPELYRQLRNALFYRKKIPYDSRPYNSDARPRMRWIAGLIGSVTSVLAAEVTIRSSQRCRRRRAMASAKVAAGLGYHAARRGERARRSAFYAPAGGRVRR